ncbi:MAG: EscU/YscU/HrcU family type III secretion system export apparatus switch protein, partial [Candidatus Kapaibacteriota bacterium]
MAETPEGREKTEPATPRRLSEARQRGQVAKSVDVTTATMLTLGGFITLLFMNYIVTNLQNYFQSSISNSFFTKITDEQVQNIFLATVLFLAKTILPMLGLIYFFILASEISQVGFHIATKKFTKGLNFRTIFNPLSGLKRIFFSGRAYFELIKSLFKLLILGWVVYTILKKYIVWDLNLVNQPICQVPRILFSVTFELISIVGV